jgi:hypothetical protein
MGYIGVGKTPDHVGNGIHVPYMSQKLISQSLPLARPLDQSGDIEEFQRCGGNFFGFG